MSSPIVFVFLFFLPALALVNVDDSTLELESSLQRLRKMNDQQERLDEIPREGGRAVITLGILPLLLHYEKIERFLERNATFAADFGSFARTVFYLADLYLNNAELGRTAREVLEKCVVWLDDWLVRTSQRGLISYDASEVPPTYVEPGVDISTEALRKAVMLTFNKRAELLSGAISGSEHYALVTASTRLLTVLCFMPADAEPSLFEDLIRTQRYAIALFRLTFRRPQKMHFEDSERVLVEEYIQRIRATRDGIHESRVEEVLPKASVTTSASWLNEYAFFTVAVALVIVAARQYGGSVVEKLKETSNVARRYGGTVVEKVRETTRRYGGRIVEKVKETSRRTHESIDVFSRFTDGRLAVALHAKDFECEQLRDANAVLNETLEATRERLRSLEEEIVYGEAIKEQASVAEAELKSEIESLRSVAEQCVQHERLQEEHYAQAREISRRKEAALKERLDEQCVISESLNDAVAEMQRLITSMIEANEAMATASLQAEDY
ncbi:hypothetical protein AAVH_14460 [Aphelenchoides avenae]|nr:hypothetical protein AAVH_14460 [Aphelenchus avenae]